MRGEGPSAMGRELGTKVPTPAMNLSILVLGDMKRAEFHETRACLGRWGSVAEFSDANSAVAALSEDRLTADVIVVAQAFPGQFSHEVIDRFRRLVPLARILGLMGSWCEGEMRSGSPWPATMRTYWHQWPARGSGQLRRLATGQPCSWALPLTATEEERLLVDVTPASRSPTCVTAWNKERPGQTSEPALLVPSSGTLVAIHSHSRETADWLSAACRSRGLAGIWHRDPAFARMQGATAAIFDGTDLCDGECDTLKQFVIASRPAPVIALASFPRIEDHARALSAGASVVLSKPLLVEDLLEAVDRSITAEATSQ